MSMALFIALNIVILLAIIAGTLYTPHKLGKMLGLTKTRWLIIAFSTLTFIGIWGTGAAAQETNPVMLSLFKLGNVWLGFMFFVVLLLIVYLATSKLLPITSKVAATAIIVLSLVISFYGYIHARSYENIELDIEIAGLKQPVTLYHIPDIHLGPFGDKSRLESLVDDINRLKPDAVLINGDLIDGMEGLAPDILDPLSISVSPVYFTTGNHDNYVAIRELQNKLKALGVHVLENDIVELKGIQLVGLDYLNADEDTLDLHASDKEETIKSVMPTLSLDKERPIVVMHHSPVGIKYMNMAGADLVVSGHTHAGQIFPATLFAQFQFEYVKGLYQYQGTQVYVGQGVGTFGPPMRISTTGEATLINLIPKS
ncbi:metallophosphoesterase [Vibrio sp. JC009]|uniref:metallophosphoesterase n=1 Tax=Vibrio sp. JC009 TaxID=2912314 RepID=UPI0023AF9D24|nr:metallophosphoesterase [Vibrio sp. JC009]WED23224.1 metallophosphoesterase [Vibrio sp. JC009]